MHHITMYTDGSAIGNPGPGGWAVLLQGNGRERVLTGGCPEMTTNNRMELTALLKGLQALTSPCQVTVVTDSEYVRGVLSLGWTRKANHDLLAEVDQSLSIHRVSFQVVRAHSGHPENERVDAAARAEAERAKGTSLVVPPHDPDHTLTPQPCVSCGTPGQTGRYGPLPVCFSCYETGRLQDYFGGPNQLEDAVARAEAERAQRTGLASSSSSDHGGLPQGPDDTAARLPLLREVRLTASNTTLRALVDDLDAGRVCLQDFDQDLLMRLHDLLIRRHSTTLLGLLTSREEAL